MDTDTTQHGDDHGNGDGDGDGDGDCPPPTNPEEGCDPELIGQMACTARGIAAQADYNASYQDALAQARVDYENTRKEYRATRHAAGLEVQGLRHEVKRLIDRIACTIEQKRVLECLDDAFCEIVDELKCCADDEGCCVNDCEFAVDDVDSIDCDQLVQLIADYQRQTDAAKACFTRLVAEPAALTARVAAAQEQIAAINAALSADPATTDLKRVYAQALVAQREISRIWNGFDQTHDFVDCLCEALTCWTKGCAAVSVLTGAKAVCDCEREAATARCRRLQTETVDEVMARYDKICPPRESCDDGGSDQDDKPTDPCKDDDDDEWDVCDECGHRHKRRRDRTRAD